MDSNVEEILPGFYKITLPVPIPSLKNVFAYFVFDKDESLLIDTGWAGEDSYTALISAFAEIGFGLHNLKDIVISHLHPDHFGLGTRLKEEVPGITLMMHAQDGRQIRTNKEQMKKFWAELRNWLKENGAAAGALKNIIDANEKILENNYPALCDKMLRGGERIGVGKFEFEVIHTPGHTRGSICLYDRQDKLLFSGDTLLPRITPNISLSPSYTGNPLGDYLMSLRKLRSLGKVSKVLPSHEFVFTNLLTRIREIEQHHEERLGECLTVLETASGLNLTLFSAYEVASRLKWYSGPWETLSPWGMRAAITETAAHLEHLRSQKKVSRVQKQGNISYRLRD